MIIAERKGRIDPDTSERHLIRLRILPFVTDFEQDDWAIVRIARHHALSAYDAAYVETANRREAAIATLDRKLAVAANADGITNITD